MRKLFIVTAFLLSSGFAFGQTLQKGGSFGLHVLTVELAPGVAMDQYMDFLVNKYIPEFEKQIEGLKIFLMVGDRGEHKNKIGFVNYFESEKARDRYFPEEGVTSDEYKAIAEKLQPILDEAQKLATLSDEYSGWMILE